MQKSALKTVEPESSSESELEEIEDDENRLSDDEEFPISEDEGDESTKKKGWASSMSKILNSEKSGVLSKAKKVEDVAKKKEKKSYTFEVEGEDVKEEKPSDKDIKQALQRQKLRERRENKIKILSLRLKPSVADLDRERTFKKIATRGVVQLFNAVKNQQNTLETKLKSTKLESKRDEIIRSTDNKKNFLETLMSGPRARSEIIDKDVKKEKMEYSSGDSDDSGDDEVKESNWSALRDDFMTGKKVGWDKDDDSGEEMGEGQEESMESDSD